MQCAESAAPDAHWAATLTTVLLSPLGGFSMAKSFLTACVVLIIAGAPAIAFARTFGGYECTDDCSGHAAGYRWAEEHNIDDEDLCPPGNSLSFHEGCLVYVQDPTRGADEDDDGGDSID